jgi:hypothetical protein
MTKAEFYRDARRWGSMEIDFGVWWFEGDPHAFGRPQYRVSWVENTGELYTIRQAPPTEAQEVEILRVYPTRDAVEQALHGWGDVCGQPHSLAWVHEAVTRE